MSSPFVPMTMAFLLLLVAVTPASAEPKVLPAVWEYETRGLFPQAILRDASERNCLYVALKNGGLGVFDNSKADRAPQILSKIETRQFGGLDVMHLTQRGDLLYLALGDFFNAAGSPAGLAVVSVATPKTPKVMSFWRSQEIVQGSAAVLVHDRYAYLGGMGHGVFILDISDSRNVQKVAEILPDVDFPRKNPNKIQHPNARGFALRGEHLYVAFDGGGLRVISIADPLQPREIGRYINSGMKQKQQAYNNLVLDGTTAYVAIDYAGMEVLDIRDPGNIRQLAWWNPWSADSLKNLWFNSPSHTNQIEYDAKRRLIYMSAGDGELLVLDVSDRAKPQLVARHGNLQDNLGAWGLTLTDDQVYLTYITAAVPFRGTWSGLKAIRR